jgi:phage-related baseplate assembly protein
MSDIIANTPTTDVPSLASLPAPTFVNDSDGLNPLAVLNDMITSFQTSANRILYPAQPERLLINLYAYREILVRNAVQLTGLQNLLAFASYPVLDYLGGLLSVIRLGAQPATATLQFTLVNALTVAYTFPTGTQVGTTDGAQIFATTAPLTIQAGATTGTVPAAAQTPGIAANGYIPGQISVLIGGNALVQSVANTTTSAGGDVPEDDDHFRTRIQAAPNQFSTAGPVGAYRYWTLSANPSIIDAQIPVSPLTPGTVNVWVLTGPITIQPAASPNSIGIATTTVLNQVIAALNALTVRPLCDTVVVAAVTEVDYTITTTITYYSNASLTTIQSLIAVASLILMLNISNAVGQDIVPSQWVAALSVSGVYEVTVTVTASINGVTQSLQGDGRYVMQNGQWGNCTAFTPTYVQGANPQPP